MAAPAHANGHAKQLGGQAARRAVAGHQAAQETALAGLIGESVALHLAPLLGELVQRVTAQPECFFCLSNVVQVVRGYQVAVQNAERAGEELPPPPEPPSVNRSVTRVPAVQLAQGPGGPVPVGCSVPACFECMQAQAQVQPGQGGPRVSVGLVDVAGNPLSFRRG